MNSNSNTVVLDVAVRQEASVIPFTVVERRNKNGRVLGQRVNFCQSSASELRKELKAKNPTASGKQVSRLVNDCLTGRMDVRRAMAEFWLSGQWSEGAVPDFAEVAKSGKTSKLVLIRPDVDTEKMAQDTAALQAKVETQAEEIERYRKENEALKAAAAAKS